MNGDLEQLGERIAKQAAHLDAAMHRLLTALREFDQHRSPHSRRFYVHTGAALVKPVTSSREMELADVVGAGPAILHVATHGFYARAPDTTPAPGSRGPSTSPPTASVPPAPRGIYVELDGGMPSLPRRLRPATRPKRSINPGWR